MATSLRETRSSAVARFNESRRNSLRERLCLLALGSSFLSRVRDSRILVDNATNRARSSRLRRFGRRRRNGSIVLAAPRLLQGLAIERVRDTFILSLDVRKRIEVGDGLFGPARARVSARGAEPIARGLTQSSSHPWSRSRALSPLRSARSHSDSPPPPSSPPPSFPCLSPSPSAASAPR